MIRSAWSIVLMAGLLCALAPLAVSEAASARSASPGASGSRGTATPFSATPPAYQQYPAQTTVPTAPAPPKTSKPAETRGKYSNPYDRSVPLQGDTHKEYTGGKRDPYKR